MAKPPSDAAHDRPKLTMTNPKLDKLPDSLLRQAPTGHTTSLSLLNLRVMSIESRTTVSTMLVVMSLCTDREHQAGRLSSELQGTMLWHELLLWECDFSLVTRGKGCPVHPLGNVGLEGPLTCALHFMKKRNSVEEPWRSFFKLLPEPADLEKIEEHENTEIPAEFYPLFHINSQILN